MTVDKKDMVFVKNAEYCKKGLVLLVCSVGCVFEKQKGEEKDLSFVCLIITKRCSCFWRMSLDTTSSVRHELRSIDTKGTDGLCLLKDSDLADLTVCTRLLFSIEALKENSLLSSILVAWSSKKFFKKRRRKVRIMRSFCRRKGCT